MRSGGNHAAREDKRDGACPKVRASGVRGGESVLLPEGVECTYQHGAKAEEIEAALEYCQGTEDAAQ